MPPRPHGPSVPVIRHIDARRSQMNHDFTLDREPPPVPVATREILGGGGLKLHAREGGNPEGFPLLFIHGWSQSDLCWLNQVRGELASTARMVTFDLRGHGFSEEHPGAGHYADRRLWAHNLGPGHDQQGDSHPLPGTWAYP